MENSKQGKDEKISIPVSMATAIKILSAGTPKKKKKKATKKKK